MNQVGAVPVGMNKVDFVRGIGIFQAIPLTWEQVLGSPQRHSHSACLCRRLSPGPRLPAGAAQDPYPCLPPGSICLYTKVQSNMCCRLRKHTTIPFPADLFSWMSVESDLFLFL